MRKLAFVAIACFMPLMAHAQGGISGSGCPGNGGTGTNTEFTAGSVVFASSDNAGCGQSGAYKQDNSNLYWDDTNDRLGVGTGSPGTALHVTPLNASTTGFLYNAATSNTADLAQFSVNGSTKVVMGANGHLGIPILTMALFNTTVPDHQWAIAICNNCTSYPQGAVCIATGTAVAQWAVLGSSANAVNLTGCGTNK